jgi:hypothetical protein
VQLPVAPPPLDHMHGSVPFPSGELPAGRLGVGDHGNKREARPEERQALTGHDSFSGSKQTEVGCFASRVRCGP